MTVETDHSTPSNHSLSRRQRGFEALKQTKTAREAWSTISSLIAGIAGHREDVFGDALPDMSYRFGGTDIDVDTLLVAHSRIQGRTRAIDVAVLVHGLMTDERNWTTGTDPICDRFQATFGWTPLFVRYNTGLHISKNGEKLARRLIQLHDHWGPRLGRIQLFGHSMGGLVSRSAVAYLERRNHPVLEQIDRLFLLATPNNGCEIERLGHAVEYLLHLGQELPPHYLESVTRSVISSRDAREGGVGNALAKMVSNTAMFVPAITMQAARTVVAGRSDGIRDVRFGYMLEEEWTAAEQDGYSFMANHRRPLPAPAHIKVYAIAGSLWPDVGARPSNIRNDGVITVASAASKGGEFDDLGLVERGRFAEMPMLLHQLVPVSQRVLRQVRYWVEHD